MIKVNWIQFYSWQGKCTVYFCVFFIDQLSVQNNVSRINQIECLIHVMLAKSVNVYNISEVIWLIPKKNVSISTWNTSKDKLWFMAFENGQSCPLTGGSRWQVHFLFYTAELNTNIIFVRIFFLEKLICIWFVHFVFYTAVLNTSTISIEHY